MRPRLIVFLSCLLALAGCSGAAVLNALTSREGFETVRDVPYRSGQRGKLDLYVPADASESTPIVVFLYGGSWDSGSKDIYPFLGQSLATEGVILAVPDYRVYPDVTFPAFVEDGAQAFAKVERMARRGDGGIPAGSHPIFLMGHSAGAEIASLLAFDARYLRAAGSSVGSVSGFVGLSGPYDFLPLKEERYKRIFPEAVRAASQPINFVTPRAPPSFLAHGLRDKTVDPENTRSLARKIEAVGGMVETRFYPKLDHIGTISSFATALPIGDRDLRERVLDFVKRKEP